MTRLWMAVGALLLAAVAAASSFKLTALDEYVAKPDPSFTYYNSGVIREGNGWTAFMYNMTSLTWLTEAEVSPSVWWHQVAIVVPHFVNASSANAFLYITGSDNSPNESYPKASDEGLMIVGSVAAQTGMPGAVIWQVPNQPTVFAADPLQARRVEDALIAFSFWHFVERNSSYPEYLAYFPMVKSVIRAMDMIEAVLPTHVAGMTTAPSQFIVSGASKRGWTTWLVGAVAPQRCAAIIPIVLCALDVQKFVHRQYQFYGAFTFALSDYYALNFTADVDKPESTAMFQLIDPWYYMDRLTMPKMSINAVGDEFQMPDDQRHWAHDMPGEMNLVMLQNAEHSCVTGVLEIIPAASSFAGSIMQGLKRPSYTWAIDEMSGNITVTTDTTPLKVQVWSSPSGEGVSAGRRDFRWAALNATPCTVKVFGACVRPILWNKSKAVEVSQNVFTASFETPSAGWLGFFIEIEWESPIGDSNNYIFTSPVSVIPNTLPFPPCSGEGCLGYLV